MVDDDPDVRAILAQALEDEGYEARVARDGREALGVLGGWQPDLIVLDLMMPVMDGRAFRARQRAMPGADAVPVVVLSAAHDSLRRGDDLGAAAVLAKPFDLDALLGTLDRLTGSDAR